MIELSGVGKTFGAMRALHDITFSVPTGSVCALLGHNGAGKTTTVNILSTLLRPSSGQALVGGHDVVREADKVRAAISVTGQDASVDLLLTGRENLILFSRLRGLSRRDARKRADEMIERFDLAKAADRQVMTYSGGMRRRIDIAASLVVTPQVLFLDEPTTGLDPRSRRDVWSLVSGLRDQGVTVLLTTQYLEEADVLSDSIIILNGGEIIASGTSEQLKRHLGFAYCQVTPVSPDDLPAVAAALADYEGLEIDTDLNTVSLPAANGVATLSEVFRRIEGLGVELLDISLRKPSLDEVFLHLTERPVTA